MKKILLFVALVLVIAVGMWLRGRSSQPTVTNYEDCAEAGYPVAESYPSQCRTPQGTLYVQDIGNELGKQELIQVDEPRPNIIITSPLTIKGQARGIWFFEASFPIRLVDENDNQLGIAVAQAEGEWMTENFVPFTALLTFTNPLTKTGKLILEKDNPSGLSENADELVIPVQFENIKID